MATQLPTDAEAFARFLTEQIAEGAAEKSPEELLHIWRQDHAEATEEIRQGYKNMESGRGIPFEEVDQALREKFGFSKKEA